jgi:Xaa-Pro aminopeptidase
VTRTVHLGASTEHQRRCFTRVLQSHIALDTAVFPAGTTGYQLDCIARMPLWKTGLDYRHGTGHGVGAYLNVHEGPQGLSLMRKSCDECGLQVGMTLSNEPGYYEDGAFGASSSLCWVLSTRVLPSRARRRS